LWEIVEKLLSEITRKEWIVLDWQETTSMGDGDRKFVADTKRTPDEAMEVAEQWDFLKSVEEELEE
jgi:hypothetical protein